MFRSFLIASLTFALVACSNGNNNETTPAGNSENSQDEGRITLRGELTYRQRIALLPDATAMVRLQEKGSSDAGIIAESQLSDFGQVPIAFSLTFPEKAIVPDRDYVLKAAILGPDQQTLWTLPEPKLVNPLDDGEPHTLLMQQAPRQGRDTDEHITYECNDGQLRFTAGSDPDKALLELRGRILELPSVPSASGAKYSDGENVFWAKGGESALITIDGTTYKNCRARGA